MKTSRKFEEKMKKKIQKNLREIKNPKIHIISKNVSSESSSALNFLKKSQWAHMSIPPLAWVMLAGSKNCH